jgi:hypothetical protein
MRSMTNQQQADVLLRVWQEHRALPPDERIEALMADFFAPPPASDLEYEITLRNVSTEMESAQ